MGNETARALAAFKMQDESTLPAGGIEDKMEKAETNMHAVVVKFEQKLAELKKTQKAMVAACNLEDAAEVSIDVMETQMDLSEAKKNESNWKKFQALKGSNSQNAKLDKAQAKALGLIAAK